MKLTTIITFAAITCTICLFSACEKHDGISYFKSKCTAELNGQTYVDQLPLAFIFAVEGQKTPSFNYHEGKATFNTHLCKERGGAPLYYVTIYLYANSPEELLDKELSFDKKEIQYKDGMPTNWEYAQYCNDHKITYARVYDEIAEKGTFRITLDEHGDYRGTFTLQLSEGTMSGEFFIDK